MKKLVLGISGGLSFLIFLILLITTNQIIGAQDTQQMARRWSKENDAAQVSCFFAADSETTEDTILMFEHGIDSALTEASVVQESENPGARLWADAYSADGKITLSNNKTSVTADAIGIGGDFFLFHPLTLINGAYFSGNDLMQDYCVIDKDAAWQLFGSYDVAGMTVYISGIPHIVTGVVERPEGRLAEAAGLEGTLVYVSLETLETLGTSYGINHYEIVMPDPVTGFAYNHVKENLGKEENATEVVENSARYSLLSRLKLIGQFGVRSMNGKGIIYPYWENMARGYEDILMILTLLQLLTLLYPVILLLIAFIIWWRHKGWTLRDVRLKAKDKLERLIERLRAARAVKKGTGEPFSGESLPKEKSSGKRFRRRKKRRRKTFEDDFEEIEDFL
ncbi:MAG: ABC transporter permease [Lachnospiraceae bacterium]|nr:ABC transporter permease [Lachnospiraceae bacterium]MCI9674473.1 ABC transporter permease [Lachnospiraceae bacterium]